MISQETKDIIEKESIEFVRELFIDYGDLNAQAEIEIQNAWQVGATKYAEKLEEKDKAYNELGVKFDKEVERWQERDTDELEKRLALQTELAQLKEVAEKMGEALKAVKGKLLSECAYDTFEIPNNYIEQALTAYAEWCKQKLEMITSEEITALGWTHVGSASNGGTMQFQRGKRLGNKPPFYILEYNGRNSIYARADDPRLHDITIKKLEIGKDKKPIWTDLWKGQPENIDELNKVLAFYL